MPRMGKPADLPKAARQAILDSYKQADAQRVAPKPKSTQWKILGGETVITKMDDLEAAMTQRKNGRFRQDYFELWTQLRNWLEANAA